MFAVQFTANPGLVVFAPTQNQIKSNKRNTLSNMFYCFRHSRKKLICTNLIVTGIIFDNTNKIKVLTYIKVGSSSRSAKKSFKLHSVILIGLIGVFFYQGFLSWALTTHRTAGTWDTLCLRWLSHIFNCNTCTYQTTTQWDLPPYRITKKWFYE